MQIEVKSTGQDNTDQGKKLMLLMVQHQRAIFSFIYSLVPERHAAEDLLQETSLVICEKFGEFKPGTNFVAWACQIALWRVRAARLKFTRSKIVFDDEILNRVAVTAAKMQNELDRRHVALETCLGKLPLRDREFVMARYRSDSVEHAARQSGRSMEAAYKALSRLRKLLADCVRRQLAQSAAL